MKFDVLTLFPEMFEPVKQSILGKQVLLPGIKDVIKNVDLEGGKITVHLIPGLI